MKTFNIWQNVPKIQSPTGPWIFLGAVLAKDENDALLIAHSRFGYSGHFRVYEGI